VDPACTGCGGGERFVAVWKGGKTMRDSSQGRGGKREDSQVVEYDHRSTILPYAERAFHVELRKEKGEKDGEKVSSLRKGVGTQHKS